MLPPPTPAFLVRKFTNTTWLFFTFLHVPTQPFQECISATQDRVLRTRMFSMANTQGTLKLLEETTYTCHVGLWLSPAHVWRREDWALPAAGTGQSEGAGAECNCPSHKTSPFLLCPASQLTNPLLPLQPSSPSALLPDTVTSSRR